MEYPWISPWSINCVMNEGQRQSCVLLDVNVWIALLDPWHVHHEIAHRWFYQHQHRGWASCPLIQNAVLRILGNPRYPNSPGDPASVACLLTTWLSHPQHHFWPDGISLLDAQLVNASQLQNHSQITDSYLLALAVHHGGQLATLDARLSPAAVPGGDKALSLILE